MDRPAFEHVVAAAANALDEDEFVAIGSQAILGPHPEVPPTMQRSQELDLYPRHEPERFSEIDGTLGDGSRFQESFGYFAHGVGPETAKPPEGWEDRLIRVEVSPRLGSERRPVVFCLEPHDLVLAKCSRGIERDWEFAAAALEAGFVEVAVLEERADGLPLPRVRREKIIKQLRSFGEK